MEMLRVTGIVLIALGVILLVWDFMAYAKRKMTESFGMVWSLVAILLLIVGIVLTVLRRVDTAVCVVAIALAVLLVICLFGISQVVSVLTMKNQELAMQVSLLNQENESILQELTMIKEQNVHGQEPSIRD